MTDIEQKTLVERLRIIPDQNGLMYGDYEDVMQAADLIEQHEAFRQEVNDAAGDTRFMVEKHCDTEALVLVSNRLNKFIIPKPKPDPLVKVLEKMGWYNAPNAPEDAETIRAALDALGFEIREKNDGQNRT